MNMFPDMAPMRNDKKSVCLESCGKQAASIKCTCLFWTFRITNILTLMQRKMKVSSISDKYCFAQMGVLSLLMCAIFNVRI